MKVLIVEDDESVARFLKKALTECGYTIEVVYDGEQACEKATLQVFDLILLDVMLPGIDGFEVCRRLRGMRISTPILILTARDSLEDKIAGLDGGADDYIVKPFQLAELFARARALLRRGSSSPVVLQIADLTLDPASRQASRAGQVINLSATEYSLLEYLMRNEGHVLTKSMIMEHVWQYDFDGNDNVLNVYISYLRRKIDKGHAVPLIHTVRSVGYRMDGHEAV